MDDAAGETRRARGTTLLTLTLATLTGAVLGATVALLMAPRHAALFEVRMPWQGGAPVAAEWPRPAREGESATLTSGPSGLVLVVRAARAPLAHDLAQGLAARHASDVQALAAALAQARARWLSRAAMAPAGPSPDPSPTLDRAALLLANAQRARDLAGCLPAPYAGPAFAGPFAPPASLEQAIDDYTRAARDGDARTLAQYRHALDVGQDAWIAAGMGARDADAASRGARWRTWQLVRAESDEALANELLNTLPEAERTLAPAPTNAWLLAIDRDAAPAYDALAAATPVPAVPVPAPLPAPWARLLGAGALLGALGALLTAALGTVMRRAPRAPEPAFDGARDPGAAGPWLHLVAGPNATAVARAALELSAHALARGERVLIVDGGPKLALHERFGREARWGLMECLLADMPVLGLVQYGGRPGFYLLAHGNAARGEGWASLGQRLDDAKPHFGRIILALDTTAPRAVGDALLGRALEAWWAEPVERLPKGAMELTTRLGIAFSGIDLSAIPEVSLEGMTRRAELLRVAVPEPAPVAIPATPAPALKLVPPPAPEPVVLDCDLQVLQRLRFLAWMRRVQSESQPVEA